MTDTTRRCAFCLSDIDGSTAKNIAGDPICEECIIAHIIPKFWEAVKFSSQYPVTWGAGVTLQPEDFKQYFNTGEWDDFQRGWEIREDEYGCARKLRIYCKSCNAFAGTRNPQGMTAERIDFFWCRGCSTMLCANCGSHEHQFENCDRVDEPEDKSIDPTEGVKFCPNEECGAPILLYDGCNECACGDCQQEFCFHCLSKNPAPDHWLRGSSCPRFRSNGEASPIYDSPVEEEDEEEEEEEEEAEGENENENENKGEEEDANSDRTPAIINDDETGQINFSGEHQTRWNDRMLTREDDWILSTLEVESWFVELLHLPPIPQTNLPGPDEFEVGDTLSNLTALIEIHADFIDGALEHIAEDPEDYTNAGLQPSSLRNLLLALRQNLDVYVWRQRNPVNAEPYRRRHVEVILPSAYYLFGDEDTRQWAWTSAFYRPLITYLSISAERFGVHGMVWRNPETRVVAGNLIELAMQFWGEDADEIITGFGNGVVLSEDEMDLS